MFTSLLDRRRLGLAALAAATAAVLPWRSSRAVHVAWEAFLQDGTCASPSTSTRIRLGDPTYGVPVGVVATPAGDPPLEFRAVGPDPLLPAVTSTMTVDVPLANLLDSPYAIVIESVDLEADSRTSIACGNVGGVPTDGEIVFGLRSQLADTSGIAWLQDVGDNATQVTLFVTQGLAGDAAGLLHTPVPSEAPATADAPAAATEVTVGSYDIYFDPSEIMIPADTDVTVVLPNLGQIGHNFSVTGHKNPDVPNLGIDVDLPFGVTKTVTVNAPAGDYYFYCNVPGHEAAGMFGTMHVVSSSE